MRITVAILLLTAAAYAQEKPTVAVATAGCGPAKVQFEVTADANKWPDTATPDQALVYVVEDHRGYPNEFDVTVKTGMDGVWNGATDDHTYLSFPVAAGEHHLCVNWQSSVGHRKQQFGLAHFTAEPGKVYYFRSKVMTVKYYESLDLEPIDSDLGRFLVASAPENYRHQKP